MPAGGGGFINISVEFEGQQALIGQFATFGQRIQTMRPAWEDVGNLLLADFAQQFASEGAYLGPQIAPLWKPLAPSTVRDRLAKRFGGEHPILQRTGQLLGSVSERGAAGNIFEVSDNGIRAGTAYPIAKFHQYGTTRMPQRKMIGLRWATRMPQRKMIGLRWATRSQILRILGDYVRQQARDAGLPMNGGE